MEKKIYQCNYFGGYFTFLSDEDSKETQATNLAWTHFGINAEDITSVELAAENETLQPVNAADPEQPKTEADFGRETALNYLEHAPEWGVIQKNLGDDIPDGDYVEMRRAGIANPDSRKYWEGFNSAIRENEAETEQPEFVCSYCGLETDNTKLVQVDSNCSDFDNGKRWICKECIKTHITYQPERQAEPVSCYFCHCPTMSTIRVDGHIMCVRCRRQAGR